MEESRLVLTQEQQLDNLRDEYKANIDLWIYEATFRQQRSEAFLTINTILVTTLGVLTAVDVVKQSLLSAAIVGVPFAIFGLLSCAVWRQILVRNSAYMRFRRHHLRGLEYRLQNVTTFRHQWQALNQYQSISVPGVNEPFQVPKPARTSALEIEDSLPWLIAGLWVVIFAAGVTLVTLSILGII